MARTATVREATAKRPDVAESTRKRRSISIGQSLALIGLSGWAVILLFPAYWMLITAFKGPSEVQAIPPSFWVRAPSLDNFSQLFNTNQPIARWLGNSGVVSIGSTIGVLVVCSLAGYSFARLRFRARDTIFWSLIATMLIPGWTTLVPLYVWTRILDLHNTYWVL
ncbi:MAG: carbohydrate ABC transporter permease, partial [Candidatus Dormibacteraceae bacterium]